MTSNELKEISLGWLISTRRAAQITQSNVTEPVIMPSGDVVQLTFSLLNNPTVKSDGFLTMTPEGYALGTTGCAFSTLTDMAAFFHSLLNDDSEGRSEEESDEQREEQDMMRTNFSATSIQKENEDGDRLNPDELEAALNAVVIGQKEAVAAVVRTVVVQDAMTAPERPGVLLLTGRPGVGKTFLAHEIVRVVNEARPNNPYILLKIDGGTLGDEMGAARLTGASAGYEGYGDEPFFSPILSHPKAVIVVDEADKLGKQALRVFLSILEGSLTLNKPVNGTSSVDFRQCVFIFTCNAVTALRNRRTDRSLPALLAERRELRLALRSSFSDELLSRVGDSVLMNEISPECIGDVVISELERNARSFGLETAFVEQTLICDIIRMADVQTFGLREVNTIIRMILAPRFAAISRTTHVISLSGTLSDVTVTSAHEAYEDNRRRRAG